MSRSYALCDIHAMVFAKKCASLLPTAVLDNIRQLESLLIIPVLDERPPTQRPSSAYTGRRPTGGTNQSQQPRSTNFQRPQKKSQDPEDWSTIRGFKPTKMDVPTTQGVEKDINDIRVTLNKLSTKNYTTLKVTILELVARIISDQEDPADQTSKVTSSPDKLVVEGLCPSDQTSKVTSSPEKLVVEGLCPSDQTSKVTSSPEKLVVEGLCPSDQTKIANFIFEIASANKFYSELYADLYQEIMAISLSVDEVFRTILNSYVETFQHSIVQMMYCDPNTDYDGYCKYVKENDRRRAMSSFVVMMVNRKVLPVSVLLDTIRHFQMYLTTYMDQADKVPECEELSELLYTVLTLAKLNPEVTQHPLWKEAIVSHVLDVSKMSAKDKIHVSLSSRTVFKHLDIIAAIRPTTK